MRLPAVLLAVILLALSGCPEPEPTPVEPTAAPEVEAAPCCSVDELVGLVADGKTDEEIIAAIGEGRGAVRPILTAGGVSDAVVEAWLNPPPKPKPTRPVAPVGKAPEAAPAPLPLSMSYSAGKNSYTLTNTGKRNLSGLKITINGKFVYKLPVTLAPGAKDNILLTSHRAGGDKLAPPVPPPGYKYPHIERISIRADQGSWSKTP